MEKEGNDQALLNYLEALGRIANTDDGKTVLKHLRNDYVDLSVLRSGAETNAIVWHTAQKELVQGIIADSVFDVETLKKNTQDGGLVNE